jgi:hypothetical protein
VHKRSRESGIVGGLAVFVLATTEVEAGMVRLALVRHPNAHPFRVRQVSDSAECCLYCTHVSYSEFM